MSARVRVLHVASARQLVLERGRSLARIYGRRQAFVKNTGCGSDTM